MIKMILGKADGSKVCVFGLSEWNIRKLKEGDPILFNLSELGLPPQDVAIFYGATEEIMETQIHNAFKGNSPP